MQNETMSHGFSRRALAPLLAGAALAACNPFSRQDRQPSSRQFPHDFLWGVATSAYQIEGALDVDGRKPCIWDVFARDPAHIADHSNAAIATDSYRRYEDDVTLIGNAQLGAYRFSIAWPRVQPDGAGGVNEKGLDYYRRLVDALLERKITPYATLYHWDLPQALFEKGGWGARDTAKRLADYAAIVADRLGDRLKNFIVLNEAAVHTIIGHLAGVHAPGLRDPKLLGPVTHHQNLGQGLAIEALRARNSGLRIGTTLSLVPSRRAGAWWDLRTVLPTIAFDEAWNGAYLDPLLRGRYPLVMLPFLRDCLKEGDLAITRQKIDFLGVNYYSPVYIKLDRTNPSYIGPGPLPAHMPRDAFGRAVDPEGLAAMLTRLRNDYGNPPLLITENGCSDPLGKDTAAILGDRFRIDYLRGHLEVVKRAMELGSPIGGYFAWTLVDNWEWDSGYTAKFGLVAMDRKTGLRTLKSSYAWYGKLAATGRLD